MSSDPSSDAPDVPEALDVPEVPDVPVRVRLMGRDFTLRIRPRDEARTRASVAYVDARLAAFRAAHPLQNETTAALIVALAIGDELLDARDAADVTSTGADDTAAHLADALVALDLHLAAALTPPRPAATTDEDEWDDDEQPDDAWDDEEGDLEPDDAGDSNAVA